MNTFYQELNQDRFFNLLPEDWYSGISISWNSISTNASIYILKDEEKIMAGGIVFSICPPDMLYNQEEAEKWLSSGYQYIGYLWVVEEFRNMKIGSEWLKALSKKYPLQKFWLTIEEESLKSFYIKNGFRLVKSLKNGKTSEWLMIYEPQA